MAVKSVILSLTRFYFPALSDEQREDYNEGVYRNRLGGEDRKDVQTLEGLMTKFLHAGVSPESIIQALETWKREDRNWPFVIAEEKHREALRNAQDNRY